MLAGAALQSATGFGFALVSAPLLFAAAEPAQAVVLLILLGLIVNLMTLGTEGRRPQPLVRDSAAMLGFGGPRRVRRPARSAARSARPRCRSGSRSACSPRSRCARSRGGGARPCRRAAALGGAPAGFTSGALTTSTNTSGPPVVLYVLARGATPVQTRDTLTFTFVGYSLLGLAALAVGRNPRGGAALATRSPRSSPPW